MAKEGQITPEVPDEDEQVLVFDVYCYSCGEMALEDFGAVLGETYDITCDVCGETFTFDPKQSLTIH